MLRTNSRLPPEVGQAIHKQADASTKGGTWNRFRVVVVPCAAALLICGVVNGLCPNNLLVRMAVENISIVGAGLFSAYGIYQDLKPPREKQAYDMA